MVSIFVDDFLLQIVQLEELLAVRHSVFIVGNAGTGKSQIWKTLIETYKNQGRRPIVNDLNPKSVSNDELFGVINAATREWKDGLFSTLMREQARPQNDQPKWIVLDGDIDPMWIESLNTVMDDNKVLTLASNERIALNREMRLIFEVGHLRSATPATVSRGDVEIEYFLFLVCFQNDFEFMVSVVSQLEFFTSMTMILAGIRKCIQNFLGTIIPNRLTKCIMSLLLLTVWLRHGLKIEIVCTSQAN